MGHYASEMGDYRDYKPSKEVLDAMEKHKQRIHAIVMAGLDEMRKGAKNTEQQLQPDSTQ